MRVGVSQHFKKIIIMLMMFVTLLPVSRVIQVDSPEVAQAQGTNLITNPRFDTTWYTKSGIDGQVPTGWELWANGQPPATDVNQFLPYTRSAPASWILKGGYVAWTGGGYQTVTVTQGQTYRFTIYAFLWACDDLQFSCTGPDGRHNDPAFNSRVKVGIDPLGGTDPNSANILWTQLAAAPDAFFPQTVDAIAEAGQITVFFYTTVSHAPALRETFWDDASLVQLGEGEGTPLNSGASTDGEDSSTTVDPPLTVPFVTPQQAQANGSVVHIVAEGDTFDSIYVAYRYLGVTRDDILSLNGWEEPPRWILLGDRILIMPPGSVDPVTGQLLTNSTGTSTGATTTTTDPPDTTDTGGSGVDTDDDFDIQKGGSLPRGSSGSFFNVRWTVPPPSVAIASRDGTVYLTHHLADNTSPDAAQHAAFIFDDVPVSIWNISSFNRVYMIDPTISRYRQQQTAGEVCLFFYDDVDKDFVATTDENILTTGSFRLNGQQYEIDSQTGITCVLNVAAGDVEIEATIPDGYTALGGQKLHVQVVSQRQVVIPFALTSAQLPEISGGNMSNLTSEDDVVSVIIENVSDDRSVFEQILDHSAFIIMGLGVLFGFIGGFTVWRFSRL